MSRTTSMCSAFSFQLLQSYVVNLDSRSDRLESFRHGLTELGYDVEAVQRVSAIRDADFGGLGCLKSHLHCLTDFLIRSSREYCCVLEDDFRFRVGCSEVESAVNALTEANPSWDVFLLAGTHPVTLPDVIATCAGHQVKKVFTSQSCAGYIVRRDYSTSLINVFMESLISMERHRHVKPRSLIYHSFAIDQRWKRLQQRDAWFCTEPMVGHQAASHSDIEGRFIDYAKVSG